MKLKNILLNITAALTLAFAAAPALTVPVYAAPPVACPSNNTSKGQVLQGLGQTGSDCSDTQVNDTLKTAVTILSIVVGIASLIVIIISGFKYVISGGESNRVTNAKNSLIYALIGLAVASVSQLLIHFVLFNTNGP